MKAIEGICHAIVLALVVGIVAAVVLASF